MRLLLEIIVVDPTTEAIVFETKVVAKDREQALLKANLPEVVRKNADAYDIITNSLGSVRAKKETQKVTVVKDEES